MVRRLAACLLALCACGMDPFAQRQEPAPRQAHAAGPQAWPGSDTLGKNKRRVAAAVRSGGGDAARAALVLAIAMQETTELAAAQRDASKDGTDAANWSAFNMNSDCLGRIGWKQGVGRDLNDDAALEEATGWVLKGLQQMGDDGFLCFHRGGAQAYQDRCSYGAQDYIAAIRGAQAFLIAHPEAMADCQRIGAVVPHV